MIRPYTKEDREELLHLLRLNTPLYFAVAEEEDFQEYLDQHLEIYYVVEEKGAIVASGGINYFAEDKLARLSWDVVHPDYQGKGVGRVLTQYRIEQIKQAPAIATVVVRTTQLVYRFYEKMGFELEEVKKDFWAEGFDLYLMALKVK
ncbi:GNAT family N-acetyltransferase [Pontibacter rugosus]|uniref:GNAT family N-acetyltransferase n=1 Tax=Pontibacter rugosus TaxID=1745966 RepID=A0ABW3SVF2_9BACT